MATGYVEEAIIGLAPALDPSTRRSRPGMDQCVAAETTEAATMAWSATQHRDGVRIIRLDLSGDLSGVAVEPLRLLVVHTISDDQPDELLINLDAVTALDAAGVEALISGYVTAIEHGSSYRVVNAHGAVRRVLNVTGTLDVLADSDDLGSLLLTALRSPLTGRRSKS